MSVPHAPRARLPLLTGRPSACRCTTLAVAAPVAPALVAEARADTASAVMSPSNIETLVTEAVALEEATLPRRRALVASAVPLRTTEPSSG